MKHKISIKKNIERFFDDEKFDNRNVYQILNVQSNFLNDMKIFFESNNVNDDVFISNEFDDFNLFEFESKKTIVNFNNDKTIDNLNNDNFFFHEFESKKTIDNFNNDNLFFS